MWLAALFACGGRTAPAAGGASTEPAPACEPAAEFVLLGGEIHTVDDARPVASALAVRGGRVLAVGADADIEPLIGPHTAVVRLAGRAVTPGLVDSHAHLYGLGMALEAVSLRDAPSEAAAAKVAAAAAGALPAGAWVTGRGWDQTLWSPAAFPSRASLDALVPDRPVAVRRVDGHALWANSAALAAAGVSRDTADPPGGKIVRDAGGVPTGVFIDAAMALVEAVIPAPSDADRERRILRGAAEAVRSGLTGVHEMGIDDATVAAYRRLEAEGRLPLRVYAFYSFDPRRLEAMRATLPLAPAPDARFAARAVKLYADGALGSRGAALLADYSDDPGNPGLMVTPPEVLTAAAEVAAARGWQLGVHAIGDRGTRAVLDAYAAARAAQPDRELRFRVEHAQVVAGDDIPRFGALGVIASMQPTHATSDMRWAQARLGPERVRGAYAWRRLLDAGARLALGSDFPVEAVSPLLGLYAAVTRQDAAGDPEGGWYPDQVLTLDEALAGFTVEAAYAAFADAERGLLAPGYLTDITVLDGPLRADRSLLERSVELTVVGGEAVFASSWARAALARRAPSVATSCPP